MGKGKVGSRKVDRNGESWAGGIRGRTAWMGLRSGV